MDSIELPSILDCFGDQITIKNTKTYTIWLEMIAKVLNMLIELKGNNYYSKVFKRVNYKLQNNTFWVVIRWEATWGKTLTLDQLQKKWWPLVNKGYVCQMNQLITFFSISPRQRIFGQCFSLFLGCSGCCQS